MKGPVAPFRPRRAVHIRIFSQKVKDAGLALSMTAVGSPHDNVMRWSSPSGDGMQVELVNRRSPENSRRVLNHDLRLPRALPRRPLPALALGMLTPTEIENLDSASQAA